MNLEGRCDGMSLENNVGNVDVVKKWQRRNMKNLEVRREGKWEFGVVEKGRKDLSVGAPRVG